MACVHAGVLVIRMFVYLFYLLVLVNGASLGTYRKESTILPQCNATSITRNCCPCMHNVSSCKTECPSGLIKVWSTATCTGHIETTTIPTTSSVTTTTTAPTTTTTAEVLVNTADDETTYTTITSMFSSLPTTTAEPPDHEERLTCMNSCPSQQFYNSSALRCEICHPTCLTCSGPGETSCDTCRYSYSNDKRCYQSCPVDLSPGHKDVNGSTICVPAKADDQLSYWIMIGLPVGGLVLIVFVVCVVVCIKRRRKVRSGSNVELSIASIEEHNGENDSGRQLEGVADGSASTEGENDSGRQLEGVADGSASTEDAPNESDGSADIYEVVSLRTDKAKKVVLKQGPKPKHEPDLQPVSSKKEVSTMAKSSYAPNEPDGDVDIYDDVFLRNDKAKNVALKQGSKPNHDTTVKSGGSKEDSGESVQTHKNDQSEDNGNKDAPFVDSANIYEEVSLCNDKAKNVVFKQGSKAKHESDSKLESPKIDSKNNSSNTINEAPDKLPVKQDAIENSDTDRQHVSVNKDTTVNKRQSEEDSGDSVQNQNNNVNDKTENNGTKDAANEPDGNAKTYDDVSLRNDEAKKVVLNQGSKPKHESDLKLESPKEDSKDKSDEDSGESVQNHNSVNDSTEDNETKDAANKPSEDTVGTVYDDVSLDTGKSKKVQLKQVNKSETESDT